MRRGRASGFADTDADARHEDLGDIQRKAGREGHDAPEAEADREKARAIGAVGPAAERNAHRRIDDREGADRGRAELRVPGATRSVEQRVEKKWVRTCRSQWRTEINKQKQQTINRT